jgi:hypothetical protein
MEFFSILGVATAVIAVLTLKRTRRSRFKTCKRH